VNIGNYPAPTLLVRIRRSENADYQYGKRRLRQIDGRIRFLRSVNRLEPRHRQSQLLATPIDLTKVSASSHPG
jgi:hypothetical protein